MVRRAIVRFKATFDERQKERMLDAAIGSVVITAAAILTGAGLIVVALGLKAFWSLV